MKLYSCIILTALFVTFLVIYFGTQPSVWPNGNAPVLPGLPKQDYEEIKKRMLRHGTLVAEMDMNGQWWFYRGGVKCQLR